MSERGARLAELAAIMRRLRAPDGCPWDLEQDHETLRPYLSEEAYEVLEAIDDGDDGELRDELGDLLLQVVFHAQLADERGAFTIDDAARLLERPDSLAELAKTPSDATAFVTNVEREFERSGIQLKHFDRFRS